MDQDERERKLEAGRAKLADFRQRRAKSESSRTQKKTQKRKGQTVEADDLPTQERHLMEEDHQTGCAEASLRLEDTDNSGAETELGRKTHEQNADEQSSSSGSVEDIGLQSESDLSVALSGKEQLMQLQAAVEKRNEIISRLSKNLQVALQSREQVQSEALQLTELIQALQQQLQQFKAKEFLRNRSQGCVDMTQVAQNQLHLLLEESQQTTKEHQKLLVNKEAEITDLQQKLSAMEKSLFQLNYAFEQKKDHNLEVTLEQHFGKYSEDMTINSETLIQSLRAELEQERKNSQKAQGLLDAFQTNVKILEEQRLEMEAKLASLTESKTGELQKCKLEKDELSKEMSRLNGLVQEFQNRLEEEETTSRHLRSKYKDDISIYDTRLQNLEEESKLKIVQMIEAHESALKHLHEEHSVEVQRIQALLDQAQQPAAFHNSVSFEHCSEIHWIKDSAEHYTENIENECAASHNYSFDVSVEGFQDALMERYLASHRQQESSINEGSTESLSTSKFELEHEVSLHISRNDANSELDQSGMSLVHGVEVELSARSFAPCQISVGEETNESADGVDLTKELLVQQCRDLSDQLEDRERLLKVLQEEVRRSAEEVEEARERWCKISAELEDAKSELEKECEKREGYEEVIKQKKREEDDLRNLLRHLQDRQQMQQPNKIDFSDLDNDTCKHLPKEQEDKLVAELQCLELIIKDGSEEKAAGESLSSEVQALFDMLLQQKEQRDKILDTHQENKELHALKYHVHEIEEKLQHTEEEKLELESNLTCLKGNLTAMEDEKDLLERRFFALESRAKSMEKVLEEELENFEHQLQFKEDKLKKDCEAREKSEEEHMEKESVLMKELHAVKQDLEEEQKHHKQQCEKLQDEHQKEIDDLKQSFEKQFSEQRTHLEEEQRKQIILIKQVHEREHDRELSQLEDQQSKEIDRLKDDFSSEIREGLETAHQAELLQTQTRHNLDIEALRLSLTNLHTAQLELAQTNMQKDKELALSELQSMLREKWAQESAMLQTRQQFELERVREQSREQEQRTQRNHQEEIKNLNEELEKRLLEETCLAEQINNLKNREAELLAEAETSRTTLFQAQARLEEAHQSREQDIKSLEKELKQALTDRDAAACAVEELVSRHKVALQEQHDRTRSLEQEVEKLQELKASSEQDFTNLWCQLEDMRTNRQQLGELKEQLLARTQRVEDIEKLKQDFTRQRQEIKEQNELELENLRAYFEERLRVSEEGHREEIALLQLRLVEGSLEDSVLKTGDASFLSEEKVEDATSDKSSQHKEELSFLRQQLEETHQQELVQMQSRMVLSYKEDLLQARTELTDQYYKEIDQLNTKHAHELEQLRARLSDNHIKEINKLRMLSAQDVARQVEAEVKEKTQQLLSSLESVSVEHKEHLCLMEMKNEELKHQVVAQSVEDGLSSQMISEEDPRLKDQLAGPASPTTELLQSAQQERDEMERRLSDLQKVLDEKQEKLEALQSSLENETNPHLVALKQKLQTLEEKLTSQRAELIEQHAVELQAQKALQDQCTSQLESLEKLCRELKLNHLKELESLKTLHGSSLATLEKELTMKYQAELDKLEAVLQEANLAQLEAQETKLQARHKQEREELEERLLGNMDTVESALLNEIEVLREENEKKLHHLKESSALEIEKVRKDEQTIREELRCELAKVYTDKISSMAAELNHSHQEKMSEALSSQKAVLENEHCAALEALAQQVVALEQQHSTALLEITSIAATEKQYQEQQLESLASQHQQQLQELRGVSARELEALRRELEEEASRQRLHFLEESNRAEAVALEDLEKTLKQQHQQTEDAYRDKMSQLTAQLQQLDTVVSQLRAEVSGLQVELESKRAETDTLESLLQGREREKQEGDNLLAILRADLSMATQHSQDLQTSRETLQCILMEIFQVTVATEENISRKLSGGSGSKAPKAETAKSSQDSETSEVMSAVGKSTPWSSTMDEGLELSQRLCESMFTGSDGEIDARGKELMLGACTRLSTSVDKLLDLLSESSQQMCGLQALFNEQFRDGGEAGASLLFQNAQFLEQLDCEARLRSQLQLELHKAEGLMEGYLAEKSTLEEALQKKETQVHRLAKELESTRNQLQELNENHGLLLRQRDALTSGLGDTEKALLVEAERLARECVEVQHQAQKDCGSLASRLRLLEQALEDQDGNAHQLDEQHRLQTEDLQQHIDALEKQLKQNRQFIDEQAVEREHERDEFQQEIKNLEAQLKNPTKAPQGGDKGQKVESLQALIKDKIDDYSVLLLAKEQCQRDVEERNEEIEKLASCIRELEQALLNNVEASRNATQLEQELHRARKNIQELTEDKEALQQQQYANKLQISALQSKLDETKHRFSDTPPDPNLRELLNSAQQDVQTKEKKVELLAERVYELERAVEVKEEEMRQLMLQLELNNCESRKTEDQLHFRITDLQETVDALTTKIEECSDESLVKLPSDLLEQKNLVIDSLNQQIFHLQQELATTTDNKVLEENQAEIEELRSVVERLRYDQERLRQAKEEESEQLHEVINKLQEELSQLDPNHHEISDPNTDSPESSVFPWSPHPSQQRAMEESLCQELSSQTLQSSHARLKELQKELDDAVGEKDALQRLLLSQQDQVDSLGQSLREEKEKVIVLEKETEELKIQLKKKQMEAENLLARVKLLEDKEQTRQSSLREHKLLLRAAEERRDELEKELDRLQEEVQQQRVEKEHLEQTKQLVSLQEQIQKDRAIIDTLETGKRELFVERETLRKRERCLQEEIEQLKQEVTSKISLLKQMQEQQEEAVAKQGEAQKEVLTCAEETLAKAETALLEREQQLIQLKAEHDSLRAELAAVKEWLSSSTERAEKLLEEGQTKDRALADLEVHNQHLKAKLRSLQDDLAVQEEELAYQQQELELLRKRCRLQDHPTKPGHSFLEDLSHDPSLSINLSSPEMLRRLDCSEQHPSRLHVSHLSEFSALELHSKTSPMEQNKGQAKASQSFNPPLETPPPIARSPSSQSVSEPLFALDSLGEEKVHELDDLDVTLSRSPRDSTSPGSVPEWVSDGYGSNVSSELEAMLKLELENTERLDAHFVEYLRCRGMSPAENTDSAAGSMHDSHEPLSPQLQAVLKRVYQESCRILSLSHRPAPSGQSRPDSEPAPPPSWQRERRALQETILSLRELLCRMADREPKTEGGDASWRCELLQAVHSLFDSEREWLHSQLQSVMAASAQVDVSALMVEMKRLFQTQEQQQWQSLEKLFSADRHSLLAEVRSLHVKLNTTAQQNQEHLQQLQKERSEDALNLLNKDVEDLQFKLKQEKTLTRDLHASLEDEKNIGAELQKRLEAELETTQQLQTAQNELQGQLLQLRVKLESVEADYQASLHAVEKEQGRVKNLQQQLQQEKLHHQQTTNTQKLQAEREDQQELQNQLLQIRLKLEQVEADYRASLLSVEKEQDRVKNLQQQLQEEKHNHQQATSKQESLQAVMNKQASRLGQLNSALEQERVVSSNLCSELQIEQSRCEALLSQERERTGCALSHLEEERSRTKELSDSLSRQAQEHSRLLDEEARRHEATTAHDRMFIQELRLQLEQERRQGEDLATMLERLQGQVLKEKRKITENAGREAREEQEDLRRLRDSLESLLMQKTEVGRVLEAERERAIRLQAELDGMKQKIKLVKEKAKEKEELMERQWRREKQEQVDKERQQEVTKDKLLELELLRQEDQQKLKRLQQTIYDMEQSKTQITSERLQRDTHTSGLILSQNTIPLNSQSHVLQDSTALSPSLIERLLKENSDFSKCLASMSEEKVSLKHTISCLEREMHVLKGLQQVKPSVDVEQCILSEKVAWQKEKTALQTTLRKAEMELSELKASNENRPAVDISNNKMQRLYERYMRAECYRKSLVYQKRYLLLLLGEFQVCEQVTLAHIARMGAQPTPSRTVSSPLIRFRTSVRVVIAISRLKFLTRKWQRATRKLSTSSANKHGKGTVPALRSDVLKPQQPTTAFNSPPTRDHAFSQLSSNTSMQAVKSPFRPNTSMHSNHMPRQTERSFSSSQDPDLSLTHYIQHLETVQHRLGDRHPGSTSVTPFPRKSDR